MKTLKHGARLLALMAVFVSNQALSYTPRLQVALFNASLVELNPRKQGLVVSYTSALYKTLNNLESVALMGHNSLRTSSYIFLAEFWQTYSLEKVILERGMRLTEEHYEELNLDVNLMRLPMQQVGPTKHAFSNTCRVATNPSFIFTYPQLLQSIDTLMRYFLKREDGQATMAALMYLKVYYYQRLHVPNSLGTYTNSGCVSDLNGLLTCADKMVNDFGTASEYVSTIASYRDYDLSVWPLDSRVKDTVARCDTPAWYFLMSAGMQEPLSDQQAITTSQTLLAAVSGITTERSKRLDINAIMEDNHAILETFYRYRTQPYSNQHKTLLMASFRQHLALTVIRTTQLLDSEPMLSGLKRN